MLWKVVKALEERAEYSQLGRNRWRAAYRGFITVCAEGTDPRDAQYNLAETFDELLANLIRAAHHRMEENPDIVVQEEKHQAGMGLARRPQPDSPGTPPRAGSSRRQVKGRKRATASDPEQ
jgi:hypothetical protein